VGWAILMDCEARQDVDELHQTAMTLMNKLCIEQKNKLGTYIE
jgi:hypothetical protein